jgi:hypothetical protein
MESTKRVTITLEIDPAGYIEVKGADGNVLPEVSPTVIKDLYQREAGVRHVGELIYDPQAQAAAGCCLLYLYIGGRWVCVIPC